GTAVLGLGRVGPAHARVVAANPRARLVAIADADAAKLEQTAAGFPGCAALADYRAALARDDVQAVVICLPHWLHERAALDAVAAGKHVLIEKPLANSLEECDRIAAAVHASPITFTVGHTQHFYPIVVAAKQLLDGERVGRTIMAIDSWYKPHNPELRPPWLLDRKLGGGMLLMDGTHMIDRLLWHLGGKVVSVKAMNGNPVYPEIAADDTAMAFLQFDTGVVATISRIAYRTGITQYGADYFGTNGQLKYRLPYGKHGEVGLWVGQNETWEKVEVANDNSLVAQFDAFLTAIETGQEPAVTVDHGREVIRVMEAIERSGETGREVLLERETVGVAR
ncbi:MAG TPA: Gfo/Idh/MocA family oxidoreductase, partial [Chloroflexota bacterium]|nr:Gfo/Idh/MocA family oxidoreductase [Chloroflexota bacterium]